MSKPFHQFPIYSLTQFFRHTHSFSLNFIPYPIHPCPRTYFSDTSSLPHPAFPSLQLSNPRTQTHTLLGTITLSYNSLFTLTVTLLPLHTLFIAPNALIPSPNLMLTSSCLSKINKQHNQHKIQTINTQ